MALLEQALSSARAAGDRLAEKTALAHLGLTWSRLRDPARALTFLSQALALARAVGDWQHEAELLWYLAIQYALLRRPEQAIAQAEATVALFERMGKPQAAWFARHLQAYRASAAGDELGEASGDEPLPPVQPLPGGVFVPGAWEAQLAAPPAAPEKVVSGPRLLDMALSATTAMVKFLGAGLKTTPPEAREKRLQTCAACAHHTGLRCRLCGCFIGAKAAMAHEECPMGKWSS